MFRQNDYLQLFVLPVGISAKLYCERYAFRREPYRDDKVFGKAYISEKLNSSNRDKWYQRH